MLTLFGISNCDSCRKARKWLDAKGEAYRFHDLRGDGTDGAMLDRWTTAVGWRPLLNTRSTTWRGLPEDRKRSLDEKKAIALMVEHPTLIKRPVVERDKSVIVGFNPERLEEFIG